ncbi:MAG TPA: lipoprotein [Candidatus Limnocylindrales bacterium]
MGSAASGRLLGVLVLAAALALAGCGQTTDLRLEGVSGTAAALGVQDVPTGQSVSFGSIMLCLSRAGSATLRSVAVHQPTGDIEVQAFAVRPNPFTRGLEGVGSARGAISDLHADLDPSAPGKTVAGVCAADPTKPTDAESAHSVELVVQVARGGGDVAGGSALDVVYEAGGSTRTAVIPFGVWLCAAACPPEANALYKP